MELAKTNIIHTITRNYKRIANYNIKHTISTVT